MRVALGLVAWLFMSLVALSQTIPNLPAVNPLSGADLTIVDQLVSPGVRQTGKATLTQIEAWIATGFPSSLPPSGAAAGGLSGTYPNPSISNGAVISQVGTQPSRSLSRWFSEVARDRIGPPTLSPRAVMTSPPTMTFGAGNGLFTVLKNAGGAGYVTGDAITLAGPTCVVYPIVTISASGGVVQAVSILVPGVCAVTATSYTQSATSGSGTGATFTGTMFSFAAASMANPVEYSQNNGVFRWNAVEPRTNISSSGYYGSGAYIGTQASFEFVSDATSVDVQVLAFNTNLQAYVDGYLVQASNFTTDSSGAGWVLNFNWGGVQPVSHHYKVIGYNLGIQGAAVTSTATIYQPTALRIPLIFHLGDSYTFGTNAASLYLTAAGITATCLNYEVLPDGIGGAGWTSTGTTLPQARISNDMLLRTQQPDYVFLDMGYNDAGGNMTTLTTNLTASVGLIQAAWPNAGIIIFGPATPLGATTNLDIVRTTLINDASALGIPFVDVRNWVNSTNDSIYTAIDNTHPTPAGYAFLGARRCEAVSGLL